MVYWNSGAELDDIALKKLHLNLLKVNDKSGSNIKHKMLEKNSSIESIRKHFRHSIVSEFFIENESTAFLISPVLSAGENPFLHIGLMVVEKKPGANLMRLLFLGNLCMAYETGSITNERKMSSRWE